MMTAQIINDLRIIPRLAILFYLYSCAYVGLWYMELAIPTINQTTFATSIWACGAAWFAFYVNSGNKK